MDLRCPHLSLAPHWADQDHRRRIVLVRAIDAIRLDGDGDYEAVSSSDALWNFERECHGLRSEIRDFVVRIGLESPYSTRFHDEDLAGLVGRSIKYGDLVGLRRGQAAGAGEADPTLEERRLVRDIESKTRGRLSEGGRQYKLVAGADVAGIPDRNSYEVVRQDEARRVLDALATGAVGRADLIELLGKARDKLSPDWRPPLAPKGLVLLRRIQAPKAVASTPAETITPSQMRAMMEKAALEIHVVDLNGKPQEGVVFQIKMPDGGDASGKLDKEGLGRAKSSTAGIFTVTFPDLDGADWDGDGALDLPPEEERSEASRYKVEQGDRLPTIAREKGFARWQTIWDFAGNAALKELRGNAHILLQDDEVSIPTKLSRVAEVQGGRAEYVLQSAAEVLRVRFAEAEASGDEPVMFRATPDAGDDFFEGELAEDGTMEIELPPDTFKVTVELFCGDGEDPFVTYEFDVGDMDPCTENTGIQARLSNLGYYDGEIDGDIGDVTKGAIVRFRREYGLPLSDEIDDVLRSALQWVHDDDDDTDDCEADHTTPEDSAAAEDANRGADDESSDEPSDETEETEADDGGADDDSAEDDEQDSDDEGPVEWEDDEWDEDQGGDDSQDGTGEERPDDSEEDQDDDSGEVTP